ncbi:hypothetical protein M8J77_018564 [Diaphorina citri]|nr:hypothetical protein M8J77_018564 [Diaphorina citri]
MTQPKLILLFSGKRKSGKDFLTDYLLERIGSQHCAIIRLSAPIKSHWAKQNGLEMDKLLGATKYKEKYRAEMITWSEAERRKDNGCFIRSAIEMAHANGKPVWIVSDMRRKSDLAWFQQHYSGVCRTVRIVCEDAIRVQRGWVFTQGIDDAETECDLDELPISDWTWLVKNNGTLQDISDQLQDIVNTATNCINSTS